MYTSIWQKIKEIVKKMLPKKTVEDVLHVNPSISDKMTEAITLWSDMYTGQAPWLKEPTSTDPERIVSLGLPAFLASEKARLATLEMKTEITEKATQDKNNKGEAQPALTADSSQTISSDKSKNKDSKTRAGFLNTSYQRLIKQIRRQLEYGIAKGGLVIKPYVKLYKDMEVKDEKPSKNVLVYNKNLPKAEIEFDFVQADRFYPLSFDANGKVVEAAFLQTKVDKAIKKVYTRIEYHKLDNHTVTVQNFAFESSDMSLADSGIQYGTNLGNPISLKQVQEWANLEPITVIRFVDRLLFAYFKMPEANTVDPYSPLGVSGYSRVVDLIKDADMQYSRLLWEYEAGEMAIDVDPNSLDFAVDPNNPHNQLNNHRLPTKQSRLFRKIDRNSEDTYEVFAPALRDVSILNGLNSIFMRIEDNTGLSRGTISDVTMTEAKTATELKLLKQRSYATNADIQAALQACLEDTVYVMDVYCTLYDVTPDGEYEISFEWDDSIIVDSESELTKRLTLMQNGISSKIETRMWYFGETEGQAREALKIVEEEAMEKLKQNIQAEKMYQGASPDKSVTDTTSKKISTGEQADDLENPNKSQTANAIKNS